MICPECNAPEVRLIDHGKNCVAGPRRERRCVACGFTWAAARGRPLDSEAIARSFTAVPTPPMKRCPDCYALVWVKDWAGHSCRETMERTMQYLLRRDAEAA